MIETIKTFLRRRPFQPFELILASGDRYQVCHPEYAFLLKGGVYVGLPARGENDSDEIPDRAVYCPALHLVGVEQLTTK